MQYLFLNLTKKIAILLIEARKCSCLHVGSNIRVSFIIDIGYLYPIYMLKNSNSFLLTSKINLQVFHNFNTNPYSYKIEISLIRIKNTSSKLPPSKKKLSITHQSQKPYLLFANFHINFIYLLKIT